MKGRILISTEGITGTLSCPAEKELNQYIERMEKFDLIDELGGVPDGYSESATNSAAAAATLVPEAGRGRLFANIDWKTFHHLHIIIIH